MSFSDEYFELKKKRKKNETKKNDISLDIETNRNWQNRADALYDGGIASSVSQMLLMPKSSGDDEEDDDIAPVKTETKSNVVNDSWGRYAESADFEQYSSAATNLHYEDFGSTKRHRGSGARKRGYTTIDDYRAASIALYERNGGNVDSKITSKYIDQINTFRNMTDEECQLLAYFIAKDKAEGTKLAEQYVDSISDTLRNRRGKEIATNVDNINIPVVEDAAKLLTGFGAGFADTYAGVVQLLGGDLPTYEYQYADQYISESLDGFAGYAYGAAKTTGGMIPSMAISSALGPVGPLAGAVMTGSSAAGNAYARAIEWGYDETRSRTYGTIIGALEGGLQYALGGISSLSGLKLDGKILSKIAAIDNMALRVSANVGWSNLKEIGEEELQNYLEPLARTVIFGEEYDAPTAAELLETAIVTTLSTGGIEGTSRIVEGVSNIKNNALTGDEKTVLDKLVDDYVTKQKEDGKKVTAAEKANFRKNTEAKLRRGFINVEEIERVLGGKDYEAYKAELDSLQETDDYKAYDNALKERKSLPELEKQLEAMKENPGTVGNIKAYDELQSRIEAIKEGRTVKELGEKLSPRTTKLFSLRDTMRSKVSERVKGTRLAESYRELERRNEKFTADPSKYENEYARQSVQHALDSGLGNGTNEFADKVEFFAALSAKTGKVYKLMTEQQLRDAGHWEEDSVTHGLVDDDGNVLLNYDSKRNLYWTVGHETGHVVENSKYEKALQDSLFKHAIAKEGLEKFNARLKEKEIAYKNKKNTTPEAELANDLLGEYVFTDYEFISNLAKTERTVFDKIFDEIKHLYNIAVAGSYQQRELEKAKHLFQKAIEEVGKEQKNTTKDGGVKQAIQNNLVDTNGKVYKKVVKPGLTIYNSLKHNNTNFSDYLIEHIFPRTFAVSNSDGTTIKVEFATDTDRIQKDGDKSPRKVRGEFTTADTTLKKIAILNIRDLIKNSEPLPHESENSHQWLDTNGWDDRKAYMRYNGKDGDKIYPVIIHIANAADGRHIIYDVSVLEKEGSTVDTGASALASLSDDGTSSSHGNEEKLAVKSIEPSGGTVAQEEANVNTKNAKYSFTAVNPNEDGYQMSDAELMEAEGKTSEEIRQETGWFRSYDNRWRYEIDDSKAVWHLDTAKPDQEHLFKFGEKQYKLGDLLEHEDLYKAYPQLKDVTVYVNPSTEFGGYVVGRNTDHIAISDVSNNSTTKWTLIHELQHIIQNIEGFAGGASKYEYSYLDWGEKEYEALEKRKEVAQKLYAILRRNGVSISKDAIGYNQSSFNISDEIIEENYFKLQNLGWNNKRTEALVDEYYKQVQVLNRTTPEGQYHATAGEIEAYDTQARLNMTAEERKAMRPNIDRDDAIVKYSMSKDSTGRDVPSALDELLKESAVRDENGQLIPMYHGTPDGSIAQFKAGTYFTDNKEYADRYQNPGASSISTGKTASNPKTFEVYLNIKKPFDLSDPEARRIYIEEYIKGGNAMGINPYLSDAEYAKIESIDWTEGEDLRDFLIDNDYDYDGLVLDEGADGGYGEEVKYRGKSYMIFSPEQAVRLDSNEESSVKYSMSKETDKTYLDAVERGDMETVEKLFAEHAKASMPDSKILKEDGSLRMVYHGTNTGDFYEFDPDYIGASSGDSGFFGMGFYFAYSKGEAAYYGARRVIPAYLNITNPFNFDRELQTFEGKKAQTGHAPDAVALMNLADKFPDIAMNITLDVSKEYGKVERISAFEFAKKFKDIIHNKTFEYQEVENNYGEKETLVVADPQVHEYEYNGETHSYRDYGFQKRWYGTPNELDVAYEYLSNSVYSYIDMPRRTNIILDYNREFTNTLKEMGYDGTIQSEYGDEAVAFDSSQIKMAKPITYDDDGNVIPLSKRFDDSKKDIRYSMSKIDDAYQKSLENEDLALAELEVKNAAELAMPDSAIRDEDGKLLPVYHGTKEMFYEFDTSVDGGKNGTAEGFGIYLSDDQEVTNAYGDRQIKMFANITKPATSFDKTITSGTLIKLIKDTCERQAQMMVEEEGYESIEDALRDTWISNYVSTYEMSIAQAYRTVANDILKTQTNDKDIVHEVMFGMAIRDYATAMDFYRNSLTPVTGFDGFVTKWENNGKTSNIYMAFDSSQLKSADAVTYDDDGNVIPLSERFDPEKKDIRYSISMDDDDPTERGAFNNRWRDFDRTDPLDIFNAAPVAEDIAPVAEEITAEAPVAENIETNVPDDDSWRESLDAITDEDAPPVPEAPAEIKTVKDRIDAKVANTQAELDKNRQLREQSAKDYDDEIARLQEKYDSKKNKNSIAANDILRRIERLKRLKGNNDANYAKRISDLEAKVEKLNSPEYRTAEQRRTKMQEYTEFWESLIGDTSTWKDLALGISYKTKTMRRFLRQVVRGADGKPDYRLADDIYNELETKYDHNEALLKRESAKLKEVFKKLDLNQHEDTYAHMLGEFRHNPQTTLTEDVVNEYYEKHKKNIDVAKVGLAITEARQTFDELLVRVNDVLREQGMKEIPFRQGYFPHFTNPKQGWLAKILNWKTINNDIPTDIAGLTEQFDPQRSWQGFNKQRKGDTTDYSLYQGLDSYIHGALDWIYHIEDLQKRRSLENYIRYVHSEEGVKAKIEEIKANEYYDADETQSMIDAVLAEAKNPLGNLVTELRARTNTLANKKSSLDRQAEELTSRKIYSVMTNLNNRINANMVVGSFSSALTNFIPMVQSWHQVSPWYTARGLGDMVRNAVKDDGMVAKSDFLTNRLMEEEKLYQTGWDKVSDKAAFMMNVIDNITSQTVWRSKYLQNIHEGMSENQAIADADQFAKNLMAGRSRGNAPSIFDAKNPLIKIATAFQLEVANQYGYMFEDVVQDSKSPVRLVKGYATAFIGAYLYNTLYSSLVGRDAAFDPLGIIEDLLRDLGIGDDDDEEDEDNVKDALFGLGENIAQEIPFVGGLLGGGRVPMSSALPYDGDVATAFEDAIDGEFQFKELLKPLYYLAMPVGGGQIKKTVEGLSMFDDDLPVAGSYTDSGKLRFPVEDTLGNRVKAAMFGQYASKNAREYFDEGYAPLSEKQIDEYLDVDLPISDYWKYRQGLKGKDSLGEKLAYIDSLDLPIRKQNILANNLADREEPIDMKDWDKYDGLEEYDYAKKYPEKYQFLEANGISVDEYNNFDEETKDAYSWAYKNPGKYATSKVVTNDLVEYRQYASDLSDIRADKDANGDSISGSAKTKKIEYINNLDIDYGAKLILFRSQYKTDDTYNYEIIDYLNGLDMTYEERVTILEELGFTVQDDGTVYWD